MARAAVRVPVPVPTRTLPARERKAVVSYEAGPAPPPAQLALAARSLAHWQASQGAPTPEGQDSPTKTQSSVPANRAAAAAAGRGDSDSDSDGGGGGGSGGDSDSDGGGGGSGGGELKKRPHCRSPAGKMWNGAIGEWENADEARAVVHAEEAQPEEAQAAHEAEGGGGRPLTETPLDRCLGAGQTPPFTLPDELPDGWVCRVHEKSAENIAQYKRYKGPHGERAQSIKQAWLLHAAGQNEAEAEEEGGGEEVDDQPVEACIPEGYERMPWVPGQPVRWFMLWQSASVQSDVQWRFGEVVKALPWNKRYTHDAWLQGMPRQQKLGVDLSRCHHDVGSLVMLRKKA